MDISKTSPDLHAIQYLSRGLSSAHSLSQLTMDQCALKSGHLEAIAPCLSQSPSLTSLSLRYNRFPASATCSLAELISNGQLDQTTGLQKLDLSGNPLQETSLGVLCHALAESRTLKHLILANCQIYPTGCEALADTLVKWYLFLSLLISHLCYFCSIQTNVWRAWTYLPTQSCVARTKG